LVVGVSIHEGQQVRKGQVLVILESMKMQNELRTPISGAVTRVKIKEGESVQQKQIMLYIVPTTSSEP